MKYRLHRRLVALGVVVAVLATVSTASAIIVSQSSGTHSDQAVAELQQQLDVATDPTVRASLQEKLRIALDSQREEREAKSQPADPSQAKAKDDSLAAANATAAAQPTITAPHVPAGDGFIVEEAMPQVSSSLFVARNDWFIPTGPGTREVVWAGAAGTDAKQSELLVISESDSSGFKIEGIYPAPIKAGALRIVGATGKVLDLLAEDGSKLEFDFVARSFR